MSRILVALCLATLAFLAAPEALRPLAVDAASPRAAATNAVSAGPESRSELRARSLRPPRPIAGRGYRLVFADPFKRLRRRVWDNREWWNTPPPRRSQYVRRGVLHLVSRRSQGYENIAVTTFSSRKIFKFGYFEARMKWTKGVASWPAFWLLSNAWARRGGNDCSLGIRAAELDVFEGYGHYPRVFTGTIHRHSATHVCPSPPDAINSNNWQPRRADLTRRFHTYAARWTPRRVTWYVDQRRMMSWPTFGTTDTKMFILLSMQVTDDPPTDSSTPNALHTKVNWVRVWQKR